MLCFSYVNSIFQSISFESSDFDGVPSERETSHLPLPKQTLTLKSHLGQNVDLGEG